jgi:hypothetical protein
MTESMTKLLSTTLRRVTLTLNVALGAEIGAAHAGIKSKELLYNTLVICLYFVSVYLYCSLPPFNHLSPQLLLRL